MSRRMDDRRALGARGEALAAAYLRGQGCVILATGWRPAALGLQGEIDLVVQDGPTLVFVEVRTRRGATPGRAEESVTPAKQRRLITLALAYLQTQALPDATDWRIDVVAVWARAAGPPVLTWLRGAVEAE
jgi:putative endonuclease